MAERGRAQIVDLRPGTSAPELHERELFTVEQAIKVLGCDRQTLRAAAAHFEAHSGCQVSWSPGEGGNPFARYTLLLASWVLVDEAPRRNGVRVEQRPIKCALAQTRGPVPACEQVRELSAPAYDDARHLAELLEATKSELAAVKGELAATKRELGHARAAVRALVLPFTEEPAASS